MAYVEVDVDLDEFDEEDLIAELESKGYLVTEKSPHPVSNPQPMALPKYFMMKVLGEAQQHFTEFEIEEILKNAIEYKTKKSA